MEAHVHRPLTQPHHARFVQVGPQDGAQPFVVVGHHQEATIGTEAGDLRRPLTPGPFASLDLADVRRGFEKKVFAHFAATQAALPFLVPDGSITFVSAISAQAAVPGTSGIGAANAAVAALVPILAVELKPRRVNGLTPGVIDTPWWNAMPADQKDALFVKFAAKTPVGRKGRADDVAQAIAFLIENSFVTGHLLTCDGGLRFTA